MAADDPQPALTETARVRLPRRVSILVVDDNPTSLLALESILEAPDHHVVRAQSADQALMALMQQDFAVIVLDVNMPEISGIDLARMIKQRKKTQNIPIIFLTGHYLESEHAVLGYGAGAVDYLTKPVHPDVLRSKISVFIDLFRKTQALRIANRELESQNVALEHQAEERLRRIQAESARAEAEAANAAKDRFLAMLSHELRTPLTPVLHAATLLTEQTDLSPESKQAVELIERNVKLEARLIDDLLDLARVRTGKLQLDFQAVDVHQLVRHALEIWAAEIHRKKLRLTTRLLANHSIVRADSSRLLQVLLNLLTNAVKFTQEGGEIAITTSEDTQGIFSIQFTDTGAGIEPPQLARIFDAFEQASQKGSSGLGLGLAICKALVEAHQGFVTAHSDGAGKGSTFEVRLPLSKVQSPAPPVKEPTPTVATPALQKLLVVEDHRDTAFALRQLLVRRGYEVRCAFSVAEALALSDEYPFDILITDIGLPDGNGIDLFESLKSRRSKDSPLRGVALSGFGMEEDLSRSNRVGFAAHLTKPVSFAQLHSCLIKISEAAVTG